MSTAVIQPGSLGTTLKEQTSGIEREREREVIIIIIGDRNSAK